MLFFFSNAYYNKIKIKTPTTFIYLKNILNIIYYLININFNIKYQKKNTKFIINYIIL